MKYRWKIEIVYLVWEEFIFKNSCLYCIESFFKVVVVNRGRY